MGTRRTKPKIGTASTRRAVRAAALASALAFCLIDAGPSLADEPCPNEALRTGPSAQLPDCRAYELTSPRLKNGYDITTEAPRAAKAGGAIVFNAQGGLPGTASAPFFSAYISRRDADGKGWTTKGVSPPLNPFAFVAFAPFIDWSEDLSRSIVQQPANSPLSPDAQPTSQDLYLRDNVADSFSLVSHSPVPFEPKPVYGGASSDFTHIVYGDPFAETPDTPPTAFNEVYEQVNGTTRVVGVLPNGDPVSGGVVLGSGEAGLDTRNAVSDDGSRIFFTSLPSENAPEGQIYVRIDGTSTVEASASQRAEPDPNGIRPATYWGATSNGSAVFFTSSSALTDDANTGPRDEGNDLYRFDVDSEELTDLSPDDSAGDPNGAEVQGVVGISDDGSYVYFVAKGLLEDGKGVAGEPNLYVWHDDAVRFIATLSFADAFTDWPNQTSSLAPLIGSRVSADGTEALITTTSIQPGFDNVDPVTGAPHSEVYRYSDIPAPSWTCVSCNPSGGPATADATLTPPPLLLGPTAGYLTRALDSNHGAVFFNSGERLVEGDENDAIDVYRWRQNEVSLISSGKGERPSFFLDADAAGENIYLATRDRLVPEDGDNLIDIYDARAGGGIAPAPTAPGCGPEPCRGTGSQQGPATEPGSSGFVGPGNPKPKPHRKPRRKRKHQHRKQHHRQAGRATRG
jgi:hypothetical protein